MVLAVFQTFLIFLRKRTLGTCLLFGSHIVCNRSKLKKKYIKQSITPIPCICHLNRTFKTHFSVDHITILPILKSCEFFINLFNPLFKWTSNYYKNNVQCNNSLEFDINLFIIHIINSSKHQLSDTEISADLLIEYISIIRRYTMTVLY